MSRIALLNSMLLTHENSEHGLLPQEAKIFMDTLLGDEDDDGLTLGDEGKTLFDLVTAA
jgi:hypothetical protein